MQHKKSEAGVYLAHLKDILNAAKNDEQLFQAIVDAPFCDKKQTTTLGLGITVFLLVNKTLGTIDRIALSNTEAASGALDYSVKQFHEIKIPLSHDKNVIAVAIAKKELQITNDWYFLFTPELTAEEARFNQAGAGIGCSVVCPLPDARDGGAMIFSFYEPPESIDGAQHEFIRNYAAIVTDALNK